ncbi:hypothetical protein NGF75_07315 [Dietzia kunjamensis]|uniref:hypothetical protein n=1 Tax=Dietzia kunjamensis TaxID=322509 RepID=UPI002DBAD6F1|nr:hypothetical protein [Dietzia kunjamensis]MEB8325795.1 hypothetical protein [Dietzia kunjamensis]
MTPRGAPDLADRARGLLGEARAAGAAVDSAAAELFRLGGEVARAGTRAEAARSGAHVAAERDLVSGLLDELDVIARVADRLVAELDRADGGGGRGAADGGPGPWATLVSIRRVIEAADSRGREGMWLGELATDRVRDFAEFELLYSRASQHLDRGRWDAADAVLPRLVALDRALVSTEIGAMLDELKFRLMTSRG